MSTTSRRRSYPGPAPMLPRSPSEFQRQRSMHLEMRSWHRAIAANALSILREAEDGKTQPEAILKAAWPNDDRAFLLLRGAVNPTARTDYPPVNVVEAFRSLAPGSAALCLFELGRRLDLTGKNSIYIPGLTNLPPHNIFVGENGAIPVAQLNFVKTTVGPTKKIAVISAVTEELNNAVPETAATVIGTVLSDVTNASIDYYAFGTQAGDTTIATGLLNGVTATNASTSTEVFQAMADDLGALAATIGAAGIDPNGIVYVAGPRESVIIKTLSGMSFDNPVLTTLGLPAKTVAAFAPAAIFFGTKGAPVIDLRKPAHATLHFEATNPAPIVGSPSVIAAPVRSAYQEDLVTIKVTADCAWAVAPGGAQFISNVTW
jgi:hypothetical protein